jgi:hypothetical protein
MCDDESRARPHRPARVTQEVPLGAGRPTTLEAIAEVVEGGGSDYIRNTYRDQTGESALAEVVLSFDSSLPTGLEQMMRERSGVQQPDQP